jgi:hypothetical protein
VSYPPPSGEGRGPMTEDDTYLIRRLIVDGFKNQRPPKMCPYCNRQAIHSDGVTCGCPECVERRGREGR